MLPSLPAISSTVASVSDFRTYSITLRPCGILGLYRWLESRGFRGDVAVGSYFDLYELGQQVDRALRAMRAMRQDALQLFVEPPEPSTATCLDTPRRLKKLIQPFLLRRTKTQVLAKLPPRTELTLQVELSDEEPPRRRRPQRQADGGGIAEIDSGIEGQV